MRSWNAGVGYAKIAMQQLEFLRANDREKKVPDQQESDDSYNNVSHGL
jgi:hypothetical protein